MNFSFFSGNNVSGFKLKDLAVGGNLQQIIAECNKEYPNFINKPLQPGIIVGCSKNDGKTTPIKGIHIKLIGYDYIDLNRVVSVIIEEDSNGYTENSRVIFFDPVVHLNIRTFINKTYTFEEFFDSNYDYINSISNVGTQNLIFILSNYPNEYKFTITYDNMRTGISTGRLQMFSGVFGKPDGFVDLIIIKIDYKRKTVSTEIKEIKQVN